MESLVVSLQIQTSKGCKRTVLCGNIIASNATTVLGSNAPNTHSAVAFNSSEKRGQEIIEEWNYKHVIIYHGCHRLPNSHDLFDQIKP